jgi:Hemerythrin HHE cation binding domain
MDVTGSRGGPWRHHTPRPPIGVPDRLRRREVTGLETEAPLPPGTVAERGDPTDLGHPVDLDQVRRRRAELREALGQLELALAAPARGRVPEWSALVRDRVEVLAQDFTEHVAASEAPDGLYASVLSVAPRLSGAIERLRREHVAIGDDVERCLARVATANEGDVAAVRNALTDLLLRFLRHRQRGSQLVWDAYATDIGGET